MMLACLWLSTVREPHRCDSCKKSPTNGSCSRSKRSIVCSNASSGTSTCSGASWAVSRGKRRLLTGVGHCDFIPRMFAVCSAQQSKQLSWCWKTPCQGAWVFLRSSHALSHGFRIAPSHSMKCQASNNSSACSCGVLECQPEEEEEKAGDGQELEAQLPEYELEVQATSDECATQVSPGFCKDGMEASE